MPLVIVAGPPGAGKTTLLAALARRGYGTVSDSAREIIAERRAAQLPPRPDPVAFAREVYRRDVAKYREAASAFGPVFFERTAIESRVMLVEALRRADQDVEVQAHVFSFVDPAFVLPPWREIYRTDDERDHSFEHALQVHEQVVACYRSHGYSVCEVPRCGPEERADYVLARLPRDGATPHAPRPKSA